MSKRIIAAVDVGSFKITSIIASIDTDDPVPQVIGVSTSPSVGIKKGVIINIDEATNSISNSISAAERMAGVTVPSIYISINGKDIQSINNKGVVAISRQDIEPDDVLRAIESARTIPLSQEREIIHVLSREFIVDSQGGIKYPIGMSGSRLEVDTHIITAPTTTTQNLIKSVQNQGLGVDGIVYTGLASSYSVLTETEKELGVLLLDIGAGTVSISMFLEGAMSLSGVIPLGSMHVTSDLAAGLQISFEEAERLKRAFPELILKNEDSIEKLSELENVDSRTALERKNIESKSNSEKSSISKKKIDEQLNVKNIGITSVETISKGLCEDIIKARIQEILELVYSYIKKSGIPITIPAGVVITGGGSKLYSITSHVKEMFGVTSRIGKPSGLRGMTEEINDSEYSVAQGLIKYAIEDESDLSQSKSTRGKGKGMDGLFDKIKKWFSQIFPTGS